MSATFEEATATVPISGGESVTIRPGQPWPSAYRGSRYSVVEDDDYDGNVLKWEQRDLRIFAAVPSGLRRKLALLGKSGGRGRIRVTADGEVLTKIPADDYANVEQAPVSDGWIPVYVGKLSAGPVFDEVDLDPSVPDGIRVWKGFPFNHGERWSVAHDGTLRWRWKDYDFESAFDHPELVETYRSYRPDGGRLYVTEYGHVWGNVDPESVAPEKAAELREAISAWQRTAEESGDAATLRLVNRRLVATSPGDDPSDGLLPVHLGRLDQFDGGVVPRPVVSDETYYAVVGRYEQVWE